MKRIIFATLALAISLGANAQISASEDFENPNDRWSMPAGWDASGEFGGYYVFVNNTDACEGEQGVWGNVYEGENTYRYVESPSYTGANEDNITVGFTLRMKDWGDDPLDYNWGTGLFQYSVDNGSTWETLYTFDQNDDLQSCTTFYYSVSSDEFDSASQIKFRWEFNWIEGDWVFLIDNFTVTQLPDVSELDCAENLSSSLNTTCNDGLANLSWDTVTGALFYKLYVGTTAGNYDVLNGQAVGNTTYQLTGLDADQGYFWKVVPATTTMEAEGCTEVTFTTLPNWCLCTPTYSQYDPDFYVDYISSLTTTGATTNINNPSTHENGGYSDFTDIPFVAPTGQTIIFNLTYQEGYSNITAWIDWNNDNVFSESERILPVEPINGYEAGNHQFTYTIPADAEEGDYLLRIRTLYGEDIETIDPCATYNFGETEDYMLTVSGEATTDPCQNYPAPTGDSNQTIDEGQTLSDLIVVADDELTWYSDAELTLEVNPEETQPENGDTFYVIQSNDDCTSEALAITITVTMGLNKAQMAELKVYPNPANDIINISYQSNIESVMIIDLTGRKVYEQTVNAKETILNIHSLNTGTYLMNIQTIDGAGIVKFVKK